MLYAFLASLAIVAIMLWEDLIVDCPDGDRYTSGKRQPYPFNRRFCHWHPQVLILASLGSVVALGALMGTWKGALLLTTLPGAWVCVTRPTTTDAPCMLLAWLASMLFPTHPYFAVLLSCLSGVIHERGPVFAVLYAWHPLLLIGLVGVQWWRKAAPADDDVRVGRGLWSSLKQHRRDHDWLNWEQTIFPLRAIPLLAAAYGTSLAAWTTLGFTWATRLVGTDLARYAFWAAPIMIRDMPDVPTWMVLAHVVTFRRQA